MHKRDLEVNEQFSRSLGYTAEELSGMPIAETSTPLGWHITEEHIQTGGVTAYETVLKRKDGTTFPAEVRGAPITHQGRPARIGAFRDISERVALERQIASIRERERKVIGRDLHDGVGQTLTGASLVLATLREQLEREGSPHAESVRDLTTMVQKSISETRHMAQMLAPNIGAEGLPAALEVLATEISGYSGVAVRVCCPHHLAFGDDETTLHVYRLVQEALNNAIRHSKATNIEVVCRRQGGMIHVEVLDDGIGIPLEKDRGRGVGLANMDQRAQMIGGACHVAIRSEGGTRVHCAYPFVEEPEPIRAQSNQVSLGGSGKNGQRYVSAQSAATAPSARLWPLAAGRHLSGQVLLQRTMRVC